MKLRKLFSFMQFTALAILLTACSDDENNVKKANAILYFCAPEWVGESFSWTEGTAKFTEINTDSKTSLDLTSNDQVNIPEGLYSISVEGKIKYGDNTTNVRGSKENLLISAPSTTIEITLSYYTTSSGIVFQEIYTTGSPKSTGTGGLTGDKFFKLYNNTDHTIYADGIALLETPILTSDDYEYTPDPIKSSFYTQVVYVIPGNGTQYPILPGKSIVIADQANDHTSNNGLDLQNADFEWYDETSTGADTDNPSVPNLDKWYSYSLSIWTPTNQCNRAFGIARIPVSKEDFLNDYYLECTYIHPANGKTMSKKGYLVPSEWILDAVNMSAKSNFKMLATPVSVDKSYAYVATTISDNSRFGKSIIRKVAETKENGRVILQDTNDSANDFQCGVTVSYKQ